MREYCRRGLDSDSFSTVVWQIGTDTGKMYLTLVNRTGDDEAHSGSS